MRGLSLLRFIGVIVGISIMMAGYANADGLKDEIAPTGKLRVAIGISAAGAKGVLDVSFHPEDPERAKKIAFGTMY